MEKDGDASKRKGEAQQEEDENRAIKRLKGTMGADAFSCHPCTQPLRPPVFQCSMGHFFWCSSCCDDEQQPSCEICAGSSSLQPSHGMDRAVESFLVDCRYADLGCKERTTYYEKESHEMTCPCARCSCPFQGCDFAGRSAELLDHLTSHHKCPCTEFRYWGQFDLRVEPGVHVLLDKDDGQVLLVNTQSVDQLQGYAISIVYVPPCTKKTGIGCSMTFSGRNHYGTWTMEHLPALSPSEWPPTDYICVVPKLSSDGSEDTGVVLNTNIVCAYLEEEEDQDQDDSSYLDSDEDSDDSWW